jgi:hypothetical protein
MAVILVAAVTVTWAGDEVCSRSVIVWDHKVRKAERVGLKVSARAEALADLARQAWGVTLYTTSSQRVARITGDSNNGFSEDEIHWRFDRSLFESNEDLYGGRYVYTGDKKFTEVRYCVTREKFERARRRIEQRRAERITSLHARFAELETMIESGDVQAAGRIFPGLKRDVDLAIAGSETYRSLRTGKSHSFAWWIDTWSSEVRSARSYSLYCAVTARNMIESGHLGQASNHLDEALAADARNVLALQLEQEVAGLRIQRLQLFDKAEQAAAVGRATASRRSLARAEDIDADDDISLERSRMRVDALLTQYSSFNPRWRVGVGLAWGSMAVDADEVATAIALTKSSGPRTEIETPLMVDFEVRARLGRLAQTWVSAGLGRSQMSSGAYTLPFLDLRTFQAGLGMRTPRNKQRPFSFQLGGGLAYESVTLQGPSETSAARTAPFVRAAIEGRRLMLFVQQGLGFENDQGETPNPIAWHDGLQVGLKWSIP